MEFSIEDVQNQWSIDSKIDLTNLETDSSYILNLHSKYFKYINFTKKMLRMFEAEKKKMVLLKTDYYLGNLSKDSLKNMDWVPNRRVVMKTDVDMFIDADEDIINLNLSIGECNDVITFCESIIRNIQNKPFIIKNIIESKKFTNGGY